MDPAFFQQVETILAPARLGAYRRDGATPATTLAAEHLAALQAGQTLALDVQSEYIAFLISAESAKQEQAIKANLRRLGYGD